MRQTHAGSDDRLQVATDFPAIGKLQMDLLAMALACDLTRVASLQWAQAFAFYIPTWVDPTITRDHHTMSHDGDNNADTIEKLTKINIWYSQQFSYLLSAMKNIPEGTNLMGVPGTTFGDPKYCTGPASL